MGGLAPSPSLHQRPDRQPDTRVQNFLGSSGMSQSLGRLRCDLVLDIALSRMPGAGITPDVANSKFPCRVGRPSVDCLPRSRVVDSTGQRRVYRFSCTQLSGHTLTLEGGSVVTIQIRQDLANVIEETVQSRQYDREDDVSHGALIQLRPGSAAAVTADQCVEH